MFETILIIPALGLLLGFVLGVIVQAWRTARCTGQSMMAILRGGGSGEDR